VSERHIPSSLQLTASFYDGRERLRLEALARQR
jgi:hypothetical protein